MSEKQINPAYYIECPGDDYQEDVIKAFESAMKHLGIQIPSDIQCLSDWEFNFLERHSEVRNPEVTP